jgi:hypothetical protein
VLGTSWWDRRGSFTHPGWLRSLECHSLALGRQPRLADADLTGALDGVVLTMSEVVQTGVRAKWPPVVSVDLGMYVLAALILH